MGLEPDLVPCWRLAQNYNPDRDGLESRRQDFLYQGDYWQRWRSEWNPVEFSGLRRCTDTRKDHWLDTKLSWNRSENQNNWHRHPGQGYHGRDLPHADILLWRGPPRLQRRRWPFQEMFSHGWTPRLDDFQRTFLPSEEGNDLGQCGFVTELAYPSRVGTDLN